MLIPLRDPADVPRLRELIGCESDAKQRDRYRAALLAVEGQETRAITDKLGRSRDFVQTWAYAYRDGGIEAIQPGKAKGAIPKLPRDQEQAFKRRMLAGPTRADGGLCTLRGRDAVAILEREFGVKYTLDGAYDLLYSQVCFRHITSRTVRTDLLRAFARALRPGGTVVVQMRFYPDGHARTVPAVCASWSDDVFEMPARSRLTDVWPTPDELHLIYADFARQFVDVRLQVIDCAPTALEARPAQLIVSASTARVLAERVNALRDEE